MPAEISAALIGSCTNSSYEDMTRAASIARQASAHGLRAQDPAVRHPWLRAGTGHHRARRPARPTFEAIGATVLANACGPCIGQWDRADADPAELNTIVNSFNRNFPKRNDGNANTKAFVTSPDMVLAYALAGTLDFDPLTDSIMTDDGVGVRLEPPVGRGPARRGFRPRRVRLRRAPARPFRGRRIRLAHARSASSS